MFVAETQDLMIKYSNLDERQHKGERVPVHTQQIDCMSTVQFPSGARHYSNKPLKKDL